MRVKHNPHGLAIYLSFGEARMLKNILVWALPKLTIVISPRSHKFLKALNPKLEALNPILDNSPYPEEYL